MKKRVLSVLLSTTMVASLLAGCGSSSSEQAADTGSSESATAASDDTGSSEATDTAAADGEVQEITWMFWDDLNATEDLISLGYKDTVDRFNKDTKAFIM